MGTTMTNQRDWYLTIAREAKAARDADGTPWPEGDAQLARFEAGDFSGVMGAENTKQGGRTVTPDGPQGSKPETVARVENGTMIGERPGPGGDGTVRFSTRDVPMTDPQRRFIAVLTKELKALGWEQLDEMCDWFLRREQDMTKGQASDVIDRLKGHRDRLSASVGTPTTPTPSAPPQQASQRRRWTPQDLRPGHYALTGADGTTDFYRVKESQRGNLYVNLQVSDSYEFAGDWDHQNTLLARIAENPQEAMIRYGKEIGRCGHCNRTLTNEESRAAGIGPICRKGMNW